MKLQPLADRVVVRVLEEQEQRTPSGIVLPDTAREKPQEGEVLAVGPGRILDSGQRQAMEVKAGDRVIFARYAGTEVKVEGEEFLILREADILAVSSR